MYTELFKLVKERSGKTTQEICDISGVSLSTINRILSGQCEKVSLYNICAFLAACGYPLEGILNESEKPISAEASLALLFEKRSELIAEPYNKQNELLEHQIEILKHDIMRADDHVAHCRESLRYRRRMCNLSFAVNILLIAFLCTMLIIDAANPDIGWFREMMARYSGDILGVFGL